MDGSSHFIIGGAPRSGTTWLYRLLDLHPEIHLAKPLRPEPKFFLIDELYEKGIGYYWDTWFPPEVRGKLCGEKSTNYLENAGVAARIQCDLPKVKLVFMLREPASRAYSNYLWSRMNGLEQETFESALELEAERELSLPNALRYARPFSYFSRGLYAGLLRPYFERFSKDHILCLRFEDIQEDAKGLAERTHRFLGVTARPSDAEDIGVINPSEKPEEAPPVNVLAQLQERYRESNRELAALLGPAFPFWAQE